MLFTVIASTLAMATTLFAPALAAPAKAQFTGKTTWYNPGFGVGACGTLHQDSEFVVALSPALFDPATPGTNPNENTLCNKRLRVQYNGKSVDVTVVDRCPGCPNQYDLDLSPTAFGVLVDLGSPPITTNWEWI